MSNLDKAVPKVDVTIGGKRRSLVFSLWAFALIEKETGKNTLNGEIFSSVNATELIAIVWAGLQASEPNLTMQEVGSMLDFGDIKDVTDAIGQAFSKAMPEPEKKVEAVEQG
jgi:hypothetical protein